MKINHPGTSEESMRFSSKINEDIEEDDDIEHH